ncbi:MAG: TIGR03067 domain-containing protein [Gemmataceae bacterium]
MVLRIASFGLLLLLTPLAVVPDTKKALKSLQGTWDVEKIKTKGEVRNAPDGNPIVKVTIKGNVMSVNGQKLARLKVDDSTTPKLMDFEVLTGGAKGKTFEGIYKMKGKTFTFCVHVGENNNRPTSFQLGDDPQLLIFVLKRSD